MEVVPPLAPCCAPAVPWAVPFTGCSPVAQVQDVEEDVGMVEDAQEDAAPAEGDKPAALDQPLAAR